MQVPWGGRLESRAAIIPSVPCGRNLLEIHVGRWLNHVDVAYLLLGASYGLMRAGLGAACSRSTVLASGHGEVYQ